MTAPRELPVERILWQRILRVVQPLMEEALIKAGVSQSDIQWTEMRWDMPDITASWPRDNPTRNIHASLRSPAWPRFYLEVEGAAWEDDEEKSQRRVRFLSFPGRQGGPAGVITVSGLAADPVVTVIDKDRLSNGLDQLAKDLRWEPLNLGVSTYPLQPKPRRINSSP